MKFDVIVGNPPFSSNPKASDKLWAKFIEISIRFLNHNGYLAYIVPSGWVSPGNYANNIMKTVNVFYASFKSSISNSFDGVGGTQRFTFFILKNEKNKGLTEFEFDDKLIKMNVFSIDYAPQKSSSSLEFSIVEKISRSKTPVHNWIRVELSNKTKAVVMPMAKSPAYIVKYEIDNLECSRYKLITSPVIGKNIAHNLNLKLYKRLRWVLRSGAALAGSFKSLPIPGQKMTDEELYKHFKLTKEEIQLIEDTVK